MNLASNVQIVGKGGKMKNERGVTLIEVVSCLVILSVLGGMAIPAAESFKAKLALHGEISKLVTELHKARITAIKGNAPVVFYYTDSGYRAFIDDGRGGGVEKDWLQQPGELTVADVKLANRSKIVIEESSFTAQRTRFSGGVGISAGAIVVRGDSGQKGKVIVNSIGRVRVEKL